MISMVAGIPSLINFKNHEEKLNFLTFLLILWVLGGLAVASVCLFSLPLSLFCVVPLFLELGILLCDNHFYNFHLPWSSSLVSFLSVGHLALYKEALMRFFVENLMFLTTGLMSAFHPVVSICGLHHCVIRAGSPAFWCISIAEPFSNMFFFVYLCSIETVPMKT